ncbi:MAG: zinc ribbon domain-containing protein [Lactobacillus crispatus]|nr:zinc ribbon domain-containing protein [Lactobacillus crispatus]
MKICPNCGSKLEAEVNFCTVCGTDVRNVAVIDSNKQVEVTEDEKVKPQEPIASTQTQNVQPENASSSVTSNDIKESATKLTQQIAGAAKSFDANSMWKWFTTSWKRPTAEQNAKNWYGWVTILVENLLVIIGMAIAGNQAINNSSVGSMLSGTSEGAELQNSATGGLFELYLFLVLNTFVTILISYLAYKFVYSKKLPIANYINKVVQIGNLSAIFDVLAFLFLLIGQMTFGIVLIFLALFMFYYSSITVVIADDGAVRDKYYGLLMFVVLDFIVSMILFTMFGQMLVSQIKGLGNSLLHTEYMGTMILNIF